jgi:two-component system phosphate regulon response regulator OmpR
MTTSTICILDDDPEIRVFLSEYLAEYEYHLIVCSTGDELIHAIASQTVNLVIIDLMLGRENGLAIASQLRQQHDFPIIMISANKEDTEKVIGLEMAVDDFMEKPINPRLLLAKTRALLRRYSPRAVQPNQTQSTLKTPVVSPRFGKFHLHYSNRTLIHEDRGDIELTNTEYNLLEFLIEKADTVVDRQTLLEGIGSGTISPLDRSIDVLILRIRRKIEEVPSKPKFLLTRRNRGYIFSIGQNKNDSV